MPEKTEFLPFHAINEYMRPDFRLLVIRETLAAQSKLAEHLSNELNHQINKRVTVPGFRNSDKAPALVKVLPTSKAYENSPELVVIILSCWVEIQSALREQVFTLLKTRNWQIFPGTEGLDPDSLDMAMLKEWPIFPIHMNRAKLPGFYTHWPKGEDFETLYKNYSELFPDSEASIDKVSLMVVWLSMRLPYHVDIEIEKSDNS